MREITRHMLTRSGRRVRRPCAGGRLVRALPAGAVLVATVLLAVSCGTGDTPAGGDLTMSGSGAAVSSSPAGVGVLPQGADPVVLDAGDFSAIIDNPYWPMSPGTTWVYRESAPDGASLRVEVTVLDDTRDVMGIQARVVHDLVTENGRPIEDTYDWYAQDSTGNIWYLGEDTKEFENGKVVSTAGSWEAGVDGAQPGVIIPADPRPGMVYRQEYYAGEAEDAAEVLSLREWVQVPAGSYTDVLMTKDYTPLQPDVLEHKFYARGVGPVLVVGISGGDDREELLSVKTSTATP